MNHKIVAIFAFVLSLVIFLHMPQVPQGFVLGVAVCTTAFAFLL